MLDVQELAEATAAIVREHVAAATKPLSEHLRALEERLAAAEARCAEPGPAGVDGKDGERGADGRDGTDCDMVVVQAQIEEVVARSVAALPAAADGANGKDGRDGLDGRDGKDGAGIADLLIDRDDNLVATFTDGRMKNLGRVVGRDGRAGADGAAGRDGFSLDQFDTEAGDDGRTVKLLFEQGDVRQVHELAFPVMIYRGVWADGADYSYGDVVTWGGSLWHCDKAGAGKPEADPSEWRLIVKRGRDGRDGAR